MIERKQLKPLLNRIDKEARKFIQVIIGPRQVGKTTLALQLIEQVDMPHHYVSADNAVETTWIAQQWEVARQVRKSQADTSSVLLVIDEVQKIHNWSEQVKALWDQDSKNQMDIRVILLGSSRLMLQRGLTESLTGRYETTFLSHWTYNEMQAAFDFTPEQYIWFGSYPGAATLINDEARWKQYVSDSLIETSISKDILMLTRVDKPTLLRDLFELGTAYSGQILAYNRMLGQLVDAGNVTTLSHYLKLLDSAGLLGGLEKFNQKKIRQRASSPKFQVHNMALKSASQPEPFNAIRQSPEKWGRWVESAVGCHLLSHQNDGKYEVFYWREADKEVDFVLYNGIKTVGIEVKSGPSRSKAGLQAFQSVYNPDKVILVGQDGLPLDKFLHLNPSHLLD